MFKGFYNERIRDFFFGIALSTILCAVSVSAPVVGFFCFLILPSPIIFYRIKLGRKFTGLMMIFSLLLVFLLSGGFGVDIFFLLGIMGLGFLIGEGTQQNLPVEKNILYAGGCILIAAAGSLIIYGDISNAGPIGAVSEYIHKNFELTISLYKQMGMPEESIRMLIKNKNEILNFLLRIMPALFTASLMVTAWINFLLTRTLLRKKNIWTDAGAPLNQWKAPEPMVWGIVGSVGMLLIPSAWMKTVGFNGVIVLMTIYFFQGMAIVSFYLEKKKIPVPLRALFYGLIVVQQILTLIVAGVGLFDVWINFRRIGINNNTK